MAKQTNRAQERGAPPPDGQPFSGATLPSPEGPSTTKNDHPDLGSLLIGLAQIHVATDPLKLAALGELAIPERPAAALQIVGQVDALLAQFRGASTTLRDLAPLLSEKEYILPPELSQVHPRILAHLSSGAENKKAPYVGLLLHGIKGTGKSEYPHYLAALLAGKARFVVASTSLIRNSPAPGQALFQLYQDLEERAKAEGIYYVVVFDEFDQLVTGEAKVFEHDTRRHSASMTKRTTNEETTVERRRALEIDGKGLEMLEAFKSILGSTGNITRVFTMANSNMDTFPEPIYREGRLERIKLDPFSMRIEISHQIGRYIVPIYDSYRDLIPRIIDIMQATHFRIRGKASPLLKAFRQEIEGFFAKRTRVGGISLEERQIDDKKRIAEFLKQNSSLLKGLVNLLRGGPKKFSYEFAGRFGCCADNEVREPHCKSIFDETEIPKKLTPEIKAINALTPAAIAGFYKLRLLHLTDLEALKLAFSDLLFPQFTNSGSKETDEPFED